MDRRQLGKALSSISTLEVNKRNRETWCVLGVTGAPGVGKSCLVDRIVQSWLEQGERVAVLAVDPSSPVSGGALLGDRLRMSSVDDGDNVYFRSIATRNHPGGIAANLDKMVDLLVSEGWTKVIIETVGAGQSEVRIAAVADRILLVEGPSRGDLIQAEKAGILELADLIVVNKSDLDGSQKTADEIQISLDMNESKPLLILCSAETGEGIPHMVQALNDLPAARGSTDAKMRERLLAAHQESLLNHPDLAEVLKGLSQGALTLEAALDALR
jgi:LAO/AO transport system kinase